MARSPYEIKAQKELENEGYFVDWKTRPRRVPRGYNVDFFGCFDLIALDKHGNLRWVSIKGRAGVPSWHRKKVESITILGTKEIWTYRVPRKSPKKEIIQ